MTPASFLHQEPDWPPPVEVQNEAVRQWCKAHGVCPPAEGFEHVWFTRFFCPPDFWRKLPTPKPIQGPCDEHPITDWGFDGSGK